MSEILHRFAGKELDAVVRRYGAGCFRHDDDVPDCEKKHLKADETGSEDRKFVVAREARQPGIEPSTYKGKTNVYLRVIIISSI